MSASSTIDHIGSRPKFEMEVDKHPGTGNLELFDSHPTVISAVKSVDSSILLVKAVNNESSLIITIEEPTENPEPNGNILHNLGSCNSDILKSGTDPPISNIVNDHNKANGRSAALAQKYAPPIDESSGDISSSPSSESDSDTVSHSSTLTLNSTAGSSYHACTVPSCGKMFSRPSRLLQHSRIHTGERPYVCPEVDCGRSYARSQHLLRHTQIAHRAPSADQSQHASADKCNQCGKQFASIYSLRKHLSQYHERRKYSCSECGQVFVKQQHLRSHSQTHSLAPAFSCDVPGCTAIFFLPSKLQRHKLLHVPGRYKCTRDPTCKQVFNRHVDLRRHLASQHPFVCTVCGVEFTEQSRYNRHRATHEDLRLTYHCTKPGCGRCYYTLRALTSHVRDSHEQRAPQHECAVCTKRFATKQKLQQHLKTHGPDCGRVMKKVVVKKRTARSDKGLGRTDYRSLLAGLTPGKLVPERLEHPKNLSAVEISRQPTDESNSKMENTSLVGEDKVLGTRRLLEGSAVARHEFVKVRQSNMSNSIRPNIKRQCLMKVNSTRETVLCQPIVSLIKLREVNDSGVRIPGSHDVWMKLNKGGDQESKPKDNISTYSESGKIGSIFISGQGAIKQSSVLLARLSDRVVDMLDDCKLTGSGT